MRAFPFFLLLIIASLSCNAQRVAHIEPYSVQEPTKRAAPSEFATLHSRMTLTARVLNAISLRLRFQDDSLTADDAILDLLNLKESMDLEDVENFSKVAVDRFFQRLQLLDLTENGSVDLTKIEKSILTTDSLREMIENVGDVTNQEALKEFMDAGEVFKDSQLDFTPLTTLKSTIESARSDLETFKNLQTADASHVALLAGIKSSANYIAAITQELLTFYQPLLPLARNLTRSSIKLTPQFKYIELVEQFLSERAQIQSVPNDVDKLQAVLDKLAAFIGDATALDSNFESMIQLIHPHFKTPSHVLLNGYSDLKMLSHDANDSWIQTAIPGYSAKRVARLLNPLVPLHDDFLALDLHWKTLRADEYVQAVEELAEIKERFLSIEGNMTEHLANVTALLTPTNAAVSTVKALKVFGDCELLSSQLRGVIRGVLYLYNWPLVNMQVLARKLEQAIPFSANPTNHANEVAVVFATMKNFTGTDVLLEWLAEISPFVEELEAFATGTPLIPLAASIYAEKDDIPNFFTSSELPGIEGYFQQVKAGSGNLNIIANGVRLAQSVRALQDSSTSTFVKSMTEITRVIDGSLQELQTLRAGMRNVKLTSSGIQWMTSALIHPASVFFDAVREVDKIRMFERYLGRLKGLKTSVRAVAEEIKKEQDPGRRQQMEKTWGFTRFYNSLKNMVSVAELVQSMPNFERFANYSSVLLYLDRLGNLRDQSILELDAKSGVITMLNVPALNPVRNELRVVNQFDLDFSRLNTSTTPHAIAVILGLFYSSHHRAVTPEFDRPHADFDPSILERAPAKSPLRAAANRENYEIISVNNSSLGDLVGLMLIVAALLIVICIVAACYLKKQNAMARTDDDQIC